MTPSERIGLLIAGTPGWRGGRLASLRRAITFNQSGPNKTRAAAPKA